MSSATWLAATSAIAGVSLMTALSVVVLLRRADERARVVGDDDEAMLPELFERFFLEAVAERPRPEAPAAPRARTRRVSTLRFAARLQLGASAPISRGHPLTTSCSSALRITRSASSMTRSYPRT